MEWGTSARIAAPPAVVWQIMTEVEKWPEWTASVRSVVRLDPGPLHVGQRVKISQPRLPTVVWRLTELVDGRLFVWQAGGPGARTVARHGVEPADDGSLASLGLVQHGPVGWLVGMLTNGLTRRYLDLEITGLKQRSESTGTGPA